MALFKRDEFAKPDDDAGVFMDHLGRALVTWTAMQDSAVTVEDAAKTFNTSPDVVREAINGALWIGYYGPPDAPDMQQIELDGE